MSLRRGRDEAERRKKASDPATVRRLLPARIVERERDHAVARNRIAEEPAAGSRDYDILLAVGALIRDGRGLRGTRQFHGPELPAGFGVERTEARIVGGGDEHESAARCDGAAVAGTAGVLLAFWQAVG